jgi:hypothetical protein
MTKEELKKKYPPIEEMNERTKKAVDLFKKIAKKSWEEKWEVAFLSGLATDASFGYLTRQHKDVDLMASRDAIEKIKEFLESEGYNVYEPDRVKGECLKVDQFGEDNPMRSHGDLHIFYTDEVGNAIIPLDRKELKFKNPLSEMIREIEFFGEKAKFLKPEFILEEKAGWKDQIGLTGHEEENEREIIKIKDLLKVTGQKK